MSLSRHPYDWIIHFFLCALPIAFGWANWIVVVFVSLMIEYEQRYQVWYRELSWRDYLMKKSLGDLLSDGLGILVGEVIWLVVR